MAMLPTFTTAPRLRLKVGNKTIAWAVGFDVRFGVSVQPVMVVGNYAPVSLEPTMVGPVSGTMQIIRMVKKESSELSVKLAEKKTLEEKIKELKSKKVDNKIIQEFEDTLQKLKDKKAAGNLSEEEQKLLEGEETKLANKVNETSFVVANAPQVTIAQSTDNAILGQSGLALHVDPVTILLSSSFDVTVYITVPKGAAGTKVLDPYDAIGKDEMTIVSNKYDVKELLTVRECRIVSRQTNIAMGQLVNEPMNFQGLLMTGSFDGDDQK